MDPDMPPFGNYEDDDIKKAFEWILSFIEPVDWDARVNAIELQLENALNPTESGVLHNRVAVHDDRSGWYLYLVKTSLFDVVKTEPAQASRVLPIFKSLGSDLDLLKTVAGVETRVRRMLFAERSQPDSILLELLVSLLWRRNGWNVEFIDEVPTEKRPDLRAYDETDEWFIECKRLQQNSDYSMEERDKWLAMWPHLRRVLYTQRLSLVFDIKFHVPLETLPDTFMATELLPMLPNRQPPTTLVDDKTWTVIALPVDYDSARKHLEKYLVKYPGDQFNELIGGRRDPNRGFTSAIEGRFQRMGDGIGNNRFLDEIGFAVGAFWSCDAADVLERKARDIRAHVAKAVNQLPAVGNTAVHVALETMDGADVEALRHARIKTSMLNFEFADRPVPWLFCHLLQSYSPPTGAWTIDETDYCFGPNANSPLENRAVIVPPEHQDPDEGYHWLKDPP